jgi:hypothetical protein
MSTERRSPPVSDAKVRDEESDRALRIVVGTNEAGEPTLQVQDGSFEQTYRVGDAYSTTLFLAVCRRQGLLPYRNPSAGDVRRGGVTAALHERAFAAPPTTSETAGTSSGPRFPPSRPSYPRQPPTRRTAGPSGRTLGATFNRSSRASTRRKSGHRACDGPGAVARAAADQAVVLRCGLAEA